MYDEITQKRFWDKVDKSGGYGCRLWTASTCLGGYGRLSADGKLRNAHRISWEIFHGNMYPKAWWLCILATHRLV
jgi:hypothetical protein